MSKAAERPGGRWARAAFALAAGVAGACGGGQPAPLDVTLDRVPSTLDPHHHNELVGWSLLCNFYDALVRFSPEMKLEPALAESWSVLDGNRVRFALRRGVRFADGAPFGSADVVASYVRALRDPQSGIRHQLVGIRRVVADGDGAVVFETAAPAPTLVNRLAFLFIVPHAEAARPEITRPLGTGPYRFVERRRDGADRGRGLGGLARHAGRTQGGVLVRGERGGARQPVPGRRRGRLGPRGRRRPRRYRPPAGPSRGAAAEPCRAAPRGRAAGGERRDEAGARGPAGEAGDAAGDRPRRPRRSGVPRQRRGRVAVRPPRGVRLRPRRLRVAVRRPPGQASARRRGVRGRLFRGSGPRLDPAGVRRGARGRPRPPRDPGPPDPVLAERAAAAGAGRRAAAADVRAGVHDGRRLGVPRQLRAQRATPSGASASRTSAAPPIPQPMRSWRPPTASSTLAAGSPCCSKPSGGSSMRSRSSP